MLYNLREYHRPVAIDEALRLLQRQDVSTVPLAGGTDLIGQQRPEIEAVVDLTGLGLDFIEREGTTLRLGAMVRLQTIVEDLANVAGGLLSETAHRMAGWHVRNVATVGGTLAGGRLHSPLSVAMAALGAQLAVTGTEALLPWPLTSPAVLKGQLLTAVVVSLPAGEAGAAYEQVARTPADAPIICAAAVAQALGESRYSTRTAVGGLLSDGLAVLDLMVEASRPDIGATDGIAGDIPDTALLSDYLGSADYRRNVAPVLARRALSAALANAGVSVR